MCCFYFFHFREVMIDYICFSSKLDIILCFIQTHYYFRIIMDTKIHLIREHTVCVRIFREITWVLLGYCGQSRLKTNRNHSWFIKPLHTITKMIMQCTSIYALVLGPLIKLRIPLKSLCGINRD